MVLWCLLVGWVMRLYLVIWINGWLICGYMCKFCRWWLVLLWVDGVVWLDVFDYCCGLLCCGYIDVSLLMLIVLVFLKWVYLIIVWFIMVGIVIVWFDGVWICYCWCFGCGGIEILLSGLLLYVDVMEMLIWLVLVILLWFNLRWWLSDV